MSGSYFVWEPPHHDITILLSLPLLDSMKAWMRQGFREGQEVGGVLLGRSQESASGQTVVTVEDFAAVQLHNRRGPTFTPNQKDTKRLENALVRRRGQTNGMLAPVGLARSHVRSGLYLDMADFTLMQNYFPGPGAVFLLVRPEPDGTGGFFFREDGDVQGWQPHLTFPFDRQELESGQTQAIVRVPEIPIIGLQRQLRSRRLLGRHRLVWLAWVVIFAALLGALWLEGRPDRNGRVAPNTELGLNVDRLGDALLLSWDPRSSVVQDARQATLWITDGETRKTIVLDRGQLAHGNVTYAPLSDRVAFRLELSDGGRLVADSIVSVVPATRSETEPAKSPVVEQQTPKPHPLKNVPPSRKATPAPRPRVPKLAVPAQQSTEFTAPAEIVKAQPAEAVAAPPIPEPLPIRRFELQPLPSVAISFRYDATPEPERKSPLRRLFHLHARPEPGDDVVPAKPVQAVKPHVPMMVAAALPGDWQMDLRARIDERGRVSQVELLSPGLDDRLAQLALNAVKRWDYQPAHSNGTAVASALIVTFQFHIPPQNPPTVAPGRE